MDDDVGLKRLLWEGRQGIASQRPDQGSPRGPRRDGVGCLVLFLAHRLCFRKRQTVRSRCRFRYRFQPERTSRVSDTEFDPPEIPFYQPAIAGERPKREEGAVSVVTQIKDSRKANSREPGFVPGTLTVLRIDQICNTAGDCRMF